MSTSLPPALLDLTPIERDALAVLATVTHPLSRSQWEEKVRAVGLRADATRGLYGEAFKAVVRKLEAVGGIAPSPYDSRNYLVPGSLVAPVLEDARTRGRLEAIVRPLLPRDSFRSWDDSGQSIRLAIALHDPERLSSALRPLAWRSPRRGEVSPLVVALTLGAPESWLAQLPPREHGELLRDAMDLSVNRLFAVGEDIVAAASRSQDPEIRARAAIQRALRGDTIGAAAIVPADAKSPWELGARASIALIDGRWSDALATFDRAATTKQGVRRARGLPSYLSVFDLLLATSPVGPASAASTLRARVEGASASLDAWPAAADALTALASFRATGRAEPISARPSSATWIEHVVCALASRWMSTPPPTTTLEALPSVARAAEAAGYSWIARQARAVLEATSPEGTLAALRSSAAPWEIALEALAGAVAPPAASKSAKERGPGEIVWVVEAIHEEFDDLRLTPRLVKKPGQLGSAISIDRLDADTSLPITPEDRPLVAALVAGKRARYGGALPLRTMLLAVGHPRVRDEDGEPIAIERGDAELRVRATTAGARLEIFPPDYAPAGIAIAREPRRIVVYERTETAARIAAVLGAEGLEVPREGLARAAETIAAIAPQFPIRGAEALGAAAGVRAQPADGRIRVQIRRAGDGFRARLRVVPGGDEGPALRPGYEPRHVLVAGGGAPRALLRDLVDERAQVERLLESCPLFAALPGDGDERIVEDLSTCLELLLELDAIRGDAIVVEWPEGQPLRAPIQRDARALRVRVTNESQWLGVDAELQIDQTRVIAFRDLLDRVTTNVGRFIPLDDGQYIALTEKLREQLDALTRVAALTDKRGRASVAMLPALTQWIDGASVELTEDLRRRVDALSRAQQTTPRVPRSLQAELRDYQREGYVFLARRASSGLGSCLADDMGLGKTVQALALLLARAKEGPALVVAPTSVCRNWEDEARRFAPTLAFHRLATVSDRAACIERLASGDVLLVSYGLLASNAEALGARRFATVVFDEAHALKNPETRRAIAARSIAADAIVALTGTPLENHLGELHSLFDVLAPGLLGTRDRFERAFAGPIGGGDKRATSHLRALVKPFLLRRTKAQVLDELPEKTEVTRAIAPSAAERAFYEALRRRAVERVEQVADARGSQARIQVLAEITKLRRAAVDPRLVGGEDAPAGCKLEALGELVTELREEGHRALVFSQFLEVLDRAGERLGALGARCVRLDGTMTADERAAAVDAFQSGQADVFLLSLRAGGVGMNLTAADYVIHLDPWWNPAVEDQATDRAHRIGQTRPVTVVRLVTEGTIEQKVLRLHADKRALYADALGDLDVAKRLDVAALAELLRDDAASRGEPRAEA